MIFKPTVDKKSRATLVCLFLASFVYFSYTNPSYAQGSSRQARVDKAIRLNNQALELANNGKPQDAILKAREALAIGIDVYGKEHVETATYTHNLADILWLSNQYQESLQLFEDAYKIRVARLGREHNNTIHSRHCLATMLTANAEYDKALSHYQGLLAFYEKKYGKTSPAVAMGLLELARVLRRKGDYTSAEKHCKNSLDMYRKTQGEKHSNTGDAMEELGLILQVTGRYTESLGYFEKLLIIRKVSPGEETREFVGALYGLATSQAELGQFEVARKALQDVVKKRELLGIQNNLDHAHVLNSLAVVNVYFDDHQSSASLLIEAERIYSRILGENNRYSAKALRELSAIYRAKGQLSQAKTFSEKAARVVKSVLGENHEEYARCLSNLGALSSELGEHEVAGSYFAKAQRITERVFGENHPRHGTSVHNLGISYSNQRDASSAARNLEQWQKLITHYIFGIMASLNDEEKLMFLKNEFTPRFEFSLSLALSWQTSNPELAVASAGWLANGKGVSLKVAAEQTILAQQARDPKTAELANELKSVRARIAKVSLAVPVPDQAEMNRAQLAEMQEQERRLIRDIGGRLAAADPRRHWVEFETIRKNLKNNSVLIDVARFNTFDARNYRGPADRNQAARYAAWITPPAGQGEVKIVDLGEAEVIDELVKQARLSTEATEMIKTGGEVLAEQQVHQKLADLAKVVLEPLLKEIAADTEKILLSPDASLWLVPWAALPIEGDRYAVEKYEFQYFTSACDLIARSVNATVISRSVIIADPDFDLSPADALAATREVLQREFSTSDQLAMRTSGSVSVLPKTATRLPFTAAEASAIKPSLERYTGKEPVVYSGQNALEGVFKAMVRPRVLVLSTHGFFLEDQRVEPSRDGLLSSEIRSVPLSTTGQPLENPLLRCGLILAGYNQRDQAGEGDDGILTGMEIVGTDLYGTELVVLSACQTGLGQINNGEGVAGLRQAFQIAGAKSVVASLWQIPDFETALLINDFFDNLAAGQSKSAALRNAQLSRIQARRDIHEAAHPFYWAAFSVTGQ